MHYQRVMKHGTPNGGNGRFATPSEALRHRSERRGECVVWTGHVNQNGYGRMNVGRNRLRVVHHVAWEQENGPIPPDMEIDHICFNRACINVEHMRLVSRRQNTRYRRGAQPNSKSGVRNVIPWGSGWAVQLKVDGKNRRYGIFESLDEAATAAAEARARVFGTP